MDSYKSPRFWLALAGLVAVTILAAIKVFSAELAAGLLGGLLYGVGVSSPTGRADVKRNLSIALAATAGIGGSLAFGGCAAGSGGSGGAWFVAVTMAAMLIACIAQAIVIRRQHSQIREWRASSETNAMTIYSLKRTIQDLKQSACRCGKNLFLLLAMLTIPFGGCVTGSDGGRSVDPARAMSLACAGNQFAVAAAELVCRSLSDAEKKAKCLDYARRASALVGAGLGVAATQIGASCPAD